MISSRTIIPVDDVRLATGEVSKETRSIVTFSTVEMVTVVVNGGLLKKQLPLRRGEGYVWVKEDETYGVEKY